MNILHFSDTHLGFSEYNKIEPQSGLNQREVDFYRAWEQVVEIILKRRPDVVIHAGDLFHTPRPSNRAIKTALENIQKISDAHIPFIFVAGNHESPRIRTTGSIFESIELFDSTFVAYSPRYKKFTIQNVDFHCVPHCSNTEETETAFKNIKISGDKNVLVTHGAWSGKNIYEMGEFNEQRLPNIESETGLTFDYIALGHYHRPVTIKDHIHYCGSTERTGLREHDSNCGYLWVGLEPLKTTFHPIKTRPMFKIPPIDCKDKNTTDIYSRLEQLSTPELKDAIVHVTLADIMDSTFLRLDMQQIDCIFEQTFVLQKSLSRYAAANSNAVEYSRIEALHVEFKKYLETIKEPELDKDVVGELGARYLSEKENV